MLVSPTPAWGVSFVFAMGKVSELDDLNPLDCPFVAQVRLEFAEHTWYYDKGYIRYWDGPTAIQREHQYVAHAAYGVRLDGGPRINIHHIDGERLNNCADNLAVMTRSGHSRLHNPSQRIVVACPVCAASFEAHWSRFISRGVKYCSVECMGVANRKVERPSPQYLGELLESVNNWTALGRMFGVSDNAVRKWAKQYDLDLSVCDGRLRR
jgi:hypothetical protein